MRLYAQTQEACCLVEMTSNEWNNLKSCPTYEVPHESLTINYSEQFFRWLDLKGFSRGYMNQIRSYFQRYFEGKTFDDPLEMQKVIYSNKGINQNVKAARAYLNFCEDMEHLPMHLIERYRKFLKKRPCNPDVYVPTDKEVMENYQLIKSHRSLKLIYVVCLFSGIRLVECIRFLKSYDIKKFRRFEGFVAYPVAEVRGCKGTNNIYLPMGVFRKLHHITNTYASMRARMDKRKCIFPLKYLRKWNYNFLIYNGVPESVADFIQGRSPGSVGARHYLARSAQANHWYGKVVNKIISSLH